MNKNPYDFFAENRRWTSESFDSENVGGSTSMRRVMFIVPICALVLLAVSVFLITEYSDNSRTLLDAWQDRSDFDFHAEELHQNAEELTRMARSYVATDDQRYLEFFQMIQDIQEGKLPRPANYNLAYWDFVLAQDSELDSAEQSESSEQLELEGPTVPLFNLLAETGVNSSEISLLQEAGEKLNEQIEMEKSAIAAAQEGNLQEAIDLLYSEEYLNVKAQVVDPMMKAIKLYDDRSLSEVLRLDDRNDRLRVELLIIVSLLIFFVVSSFVLAFFIPHPDREKSEE